MCTAISFNAHSHYFGRNLDLEYSYQESVVITPRWYPFQFRSGITNTEHYAMIGVATVVNNYPLYYDGTNEAGLSIAALNFPGNAFYAHCGSKEYSVAPFELIPWVLSQCRNVDEAQRLLQKTAIVPVSFSDEYPITDLHWLVSDKNKSIVVEPQKDRIWVHDNPYRVLTNNPPFLFHKENVQNYIQLSAKAPENNLTPHIPCQLYSRGMGAIGLPGDLSSGSRFIRALFTRNNSTQPDSEEKSVVQFFHILHSVEQQEGCVKLEDGLEKTVYSSCCNTESGVYYYTTYENKKITAVSMHHENLDDSILIPYPLLKKHLISYQN